MPDPHNFLEEFKHYQQELKEHLKEWNDKITFDKKKFGEEKKKNRIKLMQFQKKHNELQDEGNVVVQQQEDSGNDLFDQFNMLKKKIQMRKNEIDAQILKGLHDNHKADLEKTSKNVIHPVVNVLEGSNDKTDASRVKRSLFSARPFGSYQPYSLDMKPWTAADILSLRRDMFLGSDLSPPPNDYQIFKNIFDQNRLYRLRKRSIDKFIDNSINEIDNGIENKLPKSDEDIYSKVKFNKKYYKLKNFDETEKRVAKNEIVKDNSTKNENNSAHPKDKIFGSVDGRDSSIQNNIQKISTEAEERTLEKMIRNITGFLVDLGKEIGAYLKHIAYN